MLDKVTCGIIVTKLQSFFEFITENGCGDKIVNSDIMLTYTGLFNSYGVEVLKK